MNTFEIKFQLTELANKLFMYTDAKEWQKLIDEVFAEDVLFNMSSAGGGMPKSLKAKEICDTWKEGLKDLDAVHHQAGHYLITVNEDDADIYGYAVATHYKKSALNGKSRTFVGSYDLKALKIGNGWRISSFKYNLKYADGNVNLD
jgi:hypothetical protein